MQRLLLSVPRKSEVTPTAIKSLALHYSCIEDEWENLFQNISHLSADNKLRQFSFKLLHRVLTKKELNRLKQSESEDCFFSVNPLIPWDMHFWSVLLV